MNLKLKEQFVNATIYVPFENRNIVGKFIDKGLYPFMYAKYPDLFEVIEDKKIKKSDVDNKHNPKSIGDSNTGGENND